MRPPSSIGRRGVRGTRPRCGRDAAGGAAVLSTTMSEPQPSRDPAASPGARGAPDTVGGSGGVARSTLADALDAAGSTSPLRFRDRVRARSGVADVLVVGVGAERFAFDVRALDEVLEAPAVVPAPGTPVMAFRGLVRLAGRSIPVFDAGPLLGVAGGARTQLLLLRAGDARVGLLVDEVEDVVALQLSAIQPPPCDAGDDLLLGVTWDGEALTGILDARALVAGCQLRLRDGAAA